MLVGRGRIGRAGSGASTAFPEAQVNKADLIEVVSRELGSSKAAAARAVDATIAGIRSGLRKNKRVTVAGFGTFDIRRRKARTGRNPRTGEAIKIKASRSVGFKPGKALKDSV